MVAGGTALVLAGGVPDALAGPDGAAGTRLAAPGAFVARLAGGLAAGAGAADPRGARFAGAGAGAGAEDALLAGAADAPVAGAFAADAPGADAEDALLAGAFAADAVAREVRLAGVGAFAGGAAARAIRVAGWAAPD